MVFFVCFVFCFFRGSKKQCPKVKHKSQSKVNGFLQVRSNLEAAKGNFGWRYFENAKSVSCPGLQVSNIKFYNLIAFSVPTVHSIHFTFRV